MEHPWVPVSVAVSCHTAVPDPHGAGSLLGEGSRGPGPEHTLVPGSLVCAGQQMRQEVRNERRQELGVTRRCNTYQEKDFTCS